MALWFWDADFVPEGYKFIPDIFYPGMFYLMRRYSSLEMVYPPGYTERTAHWL